MEIRLTARELGTSPLAYDRACMVARNRGDRIVVEKNAQPATRGTWAFAEHGYRSVAVGVGLTFEEGAFLHMSPDAVRKINGVDHPDKSLNLIYAGGDNVFEGVSLDGHGDQFPGWSVLGIRFFGRRIHRGGSIRGLSGHRSGAESFAVSAEGATGGSVTGNVQVVDCLTEDATTYVAGIYDGATADNGLTSIVENCHVELGPFGQFAYSSSFRTVFRNCYGSAMRVWYTDWMDGIAVMENCRGQASYSVVGSIAQHAEQARDIRVVGGSYSAPEGRLIELWDKEGQDKRRGSHRGGISFSGVKATTKWRAAIDARSGYITLADCDIQSSDGDWFAPGSTVRPLVLGPIG